MPDIHSGYGFSIGNVAAFDMADPEAIVSPGGVGFDINCGVRLVRTNLFEKVSLLSRFIVVFVSHFEFTGCAARERGALSISVRSHSRWCRVTGSHSNEHERSR